MSLTLSATAAEGVAPSATLKLNAAVGPDEKRRRARFVPGRRRA